jgi:LmbE family N-acetylglucosaminyl deacetylase
MYKTALVLAPHTDDGELGCGGFISKLVSEGCEVYYIAFSAAENSVPEGLPKDILRKEVAEATIELGIKKENLFVLNYEVRRFPEFRQEILEDLIKYRKIINPDLVLIPSLNDIHQDHYTIAHEAVRAFKNTTMLGYELPWNNLTINTTCFVKLDFKFIETKMKALKCYKSQEGRLYTSDEFVMSLARTRGVQIGTEYAELFEVVRWII